MLLLQQELFYMNMLEKNYKIRLDKTKNDAENQQNIIIWVTIQKLIVIVTFLC